MKQVAAVWKTILQGDACARAPTKSWRLIVTM
jgi:hypothetical protein